MFWLILKSLKSCPKNVAQVAKKEKAQKVKGLLLTVFSTTVRFWRLTFGCFLELYNGFKSDKSQPFF
jgi:hypothetical protein